MGRNCLKLCIFMLFLLSFEGSVFARGKYKYNDVSKNVYAVEVLDVIDGDTFWAEVFYSPTISEKLNIRVAGIDTPELRGAKCDDEKVLALKAKELLEGLFADGVSVWISGVDLDKYAGRMVAEVFVSDAMDLVVADELMMRDLAAAYDGGKKLARWCD